MDKMLTLQGAIGCRRSTWQDSEVNQRIPFYRQMELLHRQARELPRLANWAEIAEVIDELVLATINTGRPVARLTEAAQAKIEKQGAS
jgi:multiple sugar transport system substrate-binding protein